MRSPTRASELVTDVQEASLPPVREEDRHRPRGAAGRSRPEVLTADIRASDGHLAGRLTTTRMKGPRGSEWALLLCVVIVVRPVRRPTAFAGSRSSQASGVA